MTFQLRPILSEIKELYLEPRADARFKEYLSKLQGNSNEDLVLPIAGFNPMAKEHIIQKIEELENIGAESIMEQTIAQHNSVLDNSSNKITVVLNLADDLKGSWTNFYSTDFDSKFKIEALAKRNFCVPYFWTSETYSGELIKVRTKEYLYRTIYRLDQPDPRTLEEFVAQEVFAAKDVRFDSNDTLGKNYNLAEAFYIEHRLSTDYNLIFNFFYGDEGSETLGYRKFGNEKNTGFNFAKTRAL